MLTVSPALMERYLFAARKIGRLALGYPTGPGVELYQLPRMLTQDDRLSDDLPFGSRGGAAVRHYFPADAEYKIKVKLKSNLYDYILGLGRPQQLDVRLDGALVKRFTVGGRERSESAAAELLGRDARQHRVRNLRARRRRGPRSHASRSRPACARSACSSRGRRGNSEGVLQPVQTGYPLAVNEQYDGLAAVDSIAIDGPFKITGPGDTPSRRRILLCTPRGGDEDACAKRILSTLARRAYRRPVTDDDVRTLLDFYEDGSEGRQRSSRASSSRSSAS